MTLEQKFFSRRRFVPEKMLAFGFITDGGAYVYRADIMGGDFSAVISVCGGEVSGKVIDNMNDEAQTSFTSK